MAWRPGTIQFRIILPLTLLVLGVMAVLHGAVLLVTVHLSERYFDLIAEGHSSQIENIVANSVSELVLGQMLDHPPVVDAKQRVTRQEILNFLTRHGLEGAILLEGRVLDSTPGWERILPALPGDPPRMREGVFRAYQGLRYLNGSVNDFPVWGWKVVAVSPPVGLLENATEAVWLIPLAVLSFLMMLAGVRIFLRHTLTGPVSQMLSDLEGGRPVGPTGLEEIDLLGSTINGSLAKLRDRSEQLRQVHEIAILLNRKGEPEETFQGVLAAATRMIGAASGTLALFPPGRGAPLVLRVGSAHRGAPGRECGELQAAVLEKGVEVVADPVSEHPVFGPLARKCCPQMRNMMATGLRSSAAAGCDLTLLFADKEGGFGEEDVRILRVVAGDIMAALGRMEAETGLRASLEEKEVLLKEVHHRVKNNLQIISGLLTLQATHLPPGEMRELFRESQDRIVTMALIHEKLYQSEDLAQVGFGDYLDALLKGLASSHGADQRGIALRAEADPSPLVVDTAIPCALITNELVSNAIQHAFPGGRKGVVWVRFARLGGDEFVLEVVDNGVGLPAGMDPLKGSTLGLKLVTVLGQQLGGRWEVGQGPGTSWRIRFREYREAGTKMY